MLSVSPSNVLCATSNKCPAVTLLLRLTATELALPTKPLLCCTVCVGAEPPPEVWTVTVALAILDGSATLAAVTLIVVLTNTAEAVNKPVEETVPAVAFQVTALFIVPVTVAVNCCAPPEGIVAETGETVTEMR